MFISLKKYAQLLQMIAILAERPYISDIIEHSNGEVTFIIAKGEKRYSLTLYTDVKGTLN